MCSANKSICLYAFCIVFVFSDILSFSYFCKFDNNTCCNITFFYSNFWTLFLSIISYCIIADSNIPSFIDRYRFYCCSICCINSFILTIYIEFSIKLFACTCLIDIYVEYSFLQYIGNFLSCTYSNCFY